MSALKMMKSLPGIILMIINLKRSLLKKKTLDLLFRFVQRRVSVDCENIEWRIKNRLLVKKVYLVPLRACFLEKKLHFLRIIFKLHDVCTFSNTYFRCTAEPIRQCKYEKIWLCLCLLIIILTHVLTFESLQNFTVVKGVLQNFNQL